MRLSSIPLVIDLVLRAVQVADPSAVVAGGCLRDTYLGEAFKDIDVFVGPGFDPDKLPYGWIATESASEEHVARYREFYATNLRRVLALDRINGNGNPLPPVQIIERTHAILPTTVLESFDLGFCQIAYDGVCGYSTETFRRDMRDNTATCMLALDDPRMEHSKERAARFMARWPTRRFLYPMVLPAAVDFDFDALLDGVVPHTRRPHG